MKKIFILTDQVKFHGGIETLVSIKASYWSKNFHYNVKIITTENGSNDSVYDIDSSVDIVDLNINYNRTKSYKSIQNILLLIKNIYKIQKIILKEKPDFIIVASHIPMTFFLPFLNLGRSKIIKEFHFTQFYRKKNQTFKEKIFDNILSKYYKLVVLSPEEKTYYNSSNVDVIPNPIPNPIEKNPITSSKSNIASAVCRFAPVKQLESMIEIWDLFINSGNKDWILKIYGDYDNEYGRNIIQLIDRLHLENNILLMGQRSNIINEISKSKVLLMTSSQECFPMVILEAQSVGVPVISFDCPTGPRNIIHHKIDGLLVSHNNLDEYSELLIQFAQDNNLQNVLSENAIKNAKQYTLDKIMNMWKEKIFE